MLRVDDDVPIISTTSDVSVVDSVGKRKKPEVDVLTLEKEFFTTVPVSTPGWASPNPPASDDDEEDDDDKKAKRCLELKQEFKQNIQDWDELKAALDRSRARCANAGPLKDVCERSFVAPKIEELNELDKKANDMLAELRGRCGVDDWGVEQIVEEARK